MADYNIVSLKDLTERNEHMIELQNLIVNCDKLLPEKVKQTGEKIKELSLDDNGKPLDKILLKLSSKASAIKGNIKDEHEEDDLVGWRQNINEIYDQILKIRKYLHEIEVHFDNAELITETRRLIQDSSYILLALQGLKNKIKNVKGLEETDEMKEIMKEFKDYLNDINLQKKLLPEYITQKTDLEDIK